MAKSDIKTLETRIDKLETKLARAKAGLKKAKDKKAGKAAPVAKDKKAAKRKLRVVPGGGAGTKKADKAGEAMPKAA